jgi:NADH dehydrogenase/NADH:ubiquinone oxidoreductase subunit G
MADEIELTIDGAPVRVAAGTTLLQAAAQAGVDIPVICYFEHTTANGLCRMCVVESEGGRVLEASCVAQARAGQVVHTRSQKVERARRTILEMLAASVNLSESPQLLTLLEDYRAQPERFGEAEARDLPVIDDNPVYIRDYSQCVLCWRCVQVCAEDAQYTYAINFSGRGFHSSIGTFFDKPMTQTTCVFCGQCVGVCPTGALKAKREYLLEQGVSPEDIFAQTRLRGLGKSSQQGPRSG